MKEKADPSKVLEKKLAAYGERFLAMFDDYEPAKAAKPSASGRGQAGAAPGQQQQQQKGKKQKGGAAAVAGSPAAAPSTAPAAVKKGGATGKAADKSAAAAGPGRPQGSPAAAPAAAAGAKGSEAGGSKRPRDEIEEIMFIDKYKKKARQDAAAAACKAASSRPLVDARMERKLFMSSKASKVHEAAAVVQPAAAADEVDEDMSHLTPEEFRKLQMEVEQLGASALDKRERKKWKAAMLARLGARPEKGPRTSAKIGLGMAKKQASREAKRLEEAIEAGMVRKKGMGKKKRREREEGRDKGLQELGRGFKNGVLRVKKPAAKGTAGSLGRGRGGGGKKRKPMKLPF